MKFSYGKTFLLGFGFFGVSVIWSVYNAYVPIFLQDRFSLAAGFIGMFMTLDNIAALFIQPAVGSWSDNLRTRIGRRLPFILIGAPIAAASFILLPAAKSLFLFFLAAVMLLLSMAVWRTPVVALMPDITPSEHRSVANGIINLMGGLGAIIAFIGGAKLYDMNPEYPFLLGAGLTVIAALLVFIFIREPKVYPKTDEEKPDLWKAVKELFTAEEKSPLLMLLAILFWFVAYAGIEALFTLYAVNYLKLGVSDGSRLLGQLSLLFVLFALPAGYIGKAFGRRRTIMLGIIFMAACVSLLFLLPADSLTIVLTKLPVLGTVPVIGVILMVVGIAWALININSLPMVVDMTDDLHIGTFTGLYYLFSTLAAIIGPTMYGWIVDFSGGKYNLVMLVSPLFLLFALVCMAFVKRGEIRKEA
ncbi:MAG: MFS transporter [Anaerolineaceae bacterium]|nr:MFS transporter [Anaerolineaceae bacterium]